MKIEVERVKKKEVNDFVTVLRSKLEETRNEKLVKTEKISSMGEIKKNW